MRDTQFDLHFADYGRMVAAAGGAPVELTRDAPSEAVLDRLDALLLSGGADIDPGTYGRTPEPGCGPVEPERDAWELGLLAGALERSLPVLAVCRGLQLVNVLRGGTLVQHVDRSDGDGHPRFAEPRDVMAHTVKITAGSLAASLYGEEIAVNSLHHQVVERVGDGLVVTAQSPDGAVEALELPGTPVLAVQWHPELLARQPDPAARWLVEEAAGRRSRPQALSGRSGFPLRPRSFVAKLLCHGRVVRPHRSGRLGRPRPL